MLIMLIIIIIIITIIIIEYSKNFWNSTLDVIMAHVHVCNRLISWSVFTSIVKIGHISSL